MSTAVKQFNPRAIEKQPPPPPEAAPQQTGPGRPATFPGAKIDLLNARIPAELVRRLKIKAVKRRIPVNKLVVELLLKGGL